MIQLREVIILIFCILISACASRDYPDLSHYLFDDYANKVACDHNRQCKFVGYGVGGSCGPTYDGGGVGGYLIYSTKMGEKNVRRLKKMAAASRAGINVNSYENIGNFKMVSEVVLEECLPTHYRKPTPMCVENQYK